MKMKEESKKVGLKLNIQKTKIMACLYIFSALFSDEVWLTNFLTWLLLFVT